MPNPTNCPLYYDDHDLCSLPWWEDDRYDDHSYQSPVENLRRCRSYDQIPFHKTHSSYRDRHHTVKIYVNIRYKQTSNHHTLLCDEVCIEINSRCCVMDVWRAAVACNRHLRNYDPTGKVLATDSHQCCFTEICSEAQIKDEYHKSERHWVFVVRPPFKCATEKKKKKKKKKPTRSSCFCGCS